MSVAEERSERIEVRTTPSVKALLQRAASASHKSVAEFLLDAGLSAAVSLEAFKWAEVLGRLGYESHYFGGELQTPPERSFPLFVLSMF